MNILVACRLRQAVVRLSVRPVIHLEEMPTGRLSHHLGVVGEGVKDYTGVTVGHCSFTDLRSRRQWMANYTRDQELSRCQKGYSDWYSRIYP